MSGPGKGSPSESYAEFTPPENDPQPREHHGGGGDVTQLVPSETFNSAKFESSVPPSSTTPRSDNTKTVRRSKHSASANDDVGIEQDDSFDNGLKSELYDNEDNSESRRVPEINLRHIFIGEIVRNKEDSYAEGFHYAGLIDHPRKSKLEVTQGPDDLGVYIAEVQVFDKENKSFRTKLNKKTKAKGLSTFFPDKWPKEQVLDEIRSAYFNQVKRIGNVVWGVSKSHVKIQIILDKHGDIHTAYPIMREKNGKR